MNTTYANSLRTPSFGFFSNSLSLMLLVLLILAVGCRDVDGFDVLSTPDCGEEDGCNEPFASICGDGITEGNEACDDGNLIAGDGCNALCILESCGNGVVDLGEECDDANTDEDDACSSTCIIQLCEYDRIFYDDGNTTFEYDIETGAESTVCAHPSEVFGDIAVNSDGLLYGIGLDDCRISNLNRTTCSLTEIGIVDYPAHNSDEDGCNSFSFLPDGTGLVGGRNTEITRIGLTPYSAEAWGSIAPFQPGVDYIYLAGKVYITTTDSHLLAVNVTGDFNFVDFEDLGVLQGVSSAYGLTYANGHLWVGTHTNELFRIDSLTPLDVVFVDMAEQRVWGLSSLSESLDCE